MNKQKLPSLLGGSMIIAGTAIGAGMLANPTAMSGIWFTGSVLLFLFIWGITTLSALMLLEANLHFEKGANFDTITTQLLGRGWNIINGISVAFTLYILTYAYITSGGSITESLFQRFVPSLPINHTFAALLFCLALALFVSISTKAVDRISTILIGGMVIAFFLSTTGLLTSAKSDILLNEVAQGNTTYLPYLLSAIPTCLVSFGYHICVPTLVNYYNKNGKKVMYAVLIGSLLSLLIYISWQTAVQGNLPRAEFAPIIAKGGDVATLLAALNRYIPTQSISVLLDFFAYMAIASSFLGVTLGLFDYIADLFKLGNDLWGRVKTALITFVPPLLMSLVYPYGFVTAIGYAGLAVSIWMIIIPALLVRASRKKYPKSSYKVFGGNTLIYLVVAFGLLNIFCYIAGQMGWIPIFKGENNKQLLSLSIMEEDYSIYAYSGLIFTFFESLFLTHLFIKKHRFIWFAVLNWVLCVTFSRIAWDDFYWEVWIENPWDYSARLEYFIQGFVYINIFPLQHILLLIAVFLIIRKLVLKIKRALSHKDTTL